MWLYFILQVIFIIRSCVPPCKANQLCNPGIGCVALSLSRVNKEGILNCHGLCINTTETPSLRCLSVPCSHNRYVECALIKDVSLCAAPPVIKDDDSCVQQGALIECPDSQACIATKGCPPPLPLVHEEAQPTTPEGELTGEQTTVVVLFLVFTVMVVLIFLTLGCIYLR